MDWLNKYWLPKFEQKIISILKIWSKNVLLGWQMSENILILMIWSVEFERQFIDWYIWLKDNLIGWIQVTHIFWPKIFLSETNLITILIEFQVKIIWLSQLEQNIFWKAKFEQKCMYKLIWAKNIFISRIRARCCLQEFVPKKINWQNLQSLFIYKVWAKNILSCRICSIVSGRIWAQNI